VVPAESAWKPGVGGRVTLTLKKGPYGPSQKAESKWPSLLAPRYKHKGVVQQWWDRAEEYKSALDALGDEDDADAEVGVEGASKTKTPKAEKGGEDDEADSEDDDEDEDEAKEERALAKKKRQAKAKAAAAKVEAKKQAKESAKAKKAAEAAEKDAAAKLDAGEGVAGFLGDALRAIAAEEAAERAAADAAHAAKKAEINAARDVQLKAIDEELAAETARLRADAEAKRQALSGSENSSGSEEAAEEEAAEEESSGGTSAAAFAPAAVSAEDAAAWRAAVDALERAGPVLSAASPGAWAGKEATHAPRVEVAAAAAVATVHVGHPAAAAGHWVEYLWARAHGAGGEDLGVVAARRFPAAGGTAAAADGLKLLVAAWPVGAASVTGYAYCNLHGVWRSEPAAVGGAASLGSGGGAGEL
jgi:desulfoferrodoxin (superoxide reductase-like protein)